MSVRISDSEFDKEVARRIDKEGLSFALDILPKSFAAPSEGEVRFMKELIDRMSLSRVGEHYNSMLSLNLCCYLADVSVPVSDIVAFVFPVLEGTVFRDRSQIKSMSVRKFDVLKDPFNDGKPFLGVSLKKVTPKW